MKIMRDNFSEKLRENTVVALGSFDGIHKGHQSLIEKTIEISKKLSNQGLESKSMVCTFYNHPLTVINNEIAPKLIMDNDKKVEVLNRMGIDIVNFMTFNKDFMEISPKEFIEKLVNCYNVKGIVVGFNFRFGYKNLGDIKLLQQYSDKLGFKLYVVPPIKMDNEIISSSKIRKYISEGNIVRANNMLGSLYTMSGTIVKGRQLGRTMGFPTINLEYNKEFILPKRGVYYTLVKYKNDIYKSMTNIGMNPTVNGEKLSVETNILDFDDTIYGEFVEIYFINKIREEQKFSNIENLMKQLNKDRNFVKNQNIEIAIN